MLGRQKGSTRTGRSDRRHVLQAGAALAGSALISGASDAGARGGELAHVQEAAATMAYHVEGRLLEVCTCAAVCPCWVGLDPDGGTCDSSMAWQIDAGTIEGIDVAGLALALSVHIPGNVLAGNWKAVVYVDDRSTEEQQAAILKVWTGQLGGPIADLAALITEVITVERAPITFTVVDGAGTLKVGDDVATELAPFKGATGAATSIKDTVFSTIPGSPAFVGTASHFWRDNRRHGLSKVDIEGHNAIQGLFMFEA